MTDEQRLARNKASGEGVRRSWLDPVKRARRLAGMRRAWDDPLRLAVLRNTENAGRFGSRARSGALS
jgi:hypothetical protein